MAGVSITVSFAGQTYSGLTDSSGVFRTAWSNRLGAGDYYANVVDLALTGFDWNKLFMDEEDDSDDDGLPDALLQL